MSRDKLNILNVILTGQPDDTNTCFNAVEVEFFGATNEFRPKLGGFEGVVYTKHPVDLKWSFNKRNFWAEVGRGPQSVYFIYPPGEAVNPNKVLDQLFPLIKQEFPTAKAIHHFTQRYAFFPHLTNCSYLKEFSSNISVGENHQLGSDMSSYMPGSIIEFALNRDGSTIFSSIFIGVDILKFKLAVLGTFFPDDVLKSKMNGGIIEHKDDRIIETGEFTPSNDPVADAKKIIQWTKALIGKV